jgi:hypothetical protein
MHANNVPEGTEGLSWSSAGTEDFQFIDFYTKKIGISRIQTRHEGHLTGESK